MGDNFVWVRSGEQKTVLIDWLLETRFISFNEGVDKAGHPTIRLYRGSEKVGIICCATEELANMAIKCVNIVLSRLNNKGSK